MANKNAIPPEHGKFKPGESGNPKGRPEGSTSLKAIADKILDKEITVEEAEGIFTKMTRREAMLLRIIEDAVNDEDPNVRLKAAGMVMDRTEGKAPNTTEHTGKDGSPIEVKVSTDTLTIEEKRLLVKLARKSKQSDE
jgi:hypothetical protein